MKKFLLVTMIGMVLVLDLCGLFKEIVTRVEEEDVISKSTITVYVE